MIFHLFFAYNIKSNHILLVTCTYLKDVIAGVAKCSIAQYLYYLFYTIFFLIFMMGANNVGPNCGVHCRQNLLELKNQDPQAHFVSIIF